MIVSEIGRPLADLLKESIALDLKNGDGREIALNLASQADVIIENFAPGTLDRLGISFARCFVATSFVG